MTWVEFNEEVRNLLPVDSNRLGTEDYIAALIRQAVLNLQEFVPRFRQGHEADYGVDDLDVEGSASLGDKPTVTAKIREAFILRTDETGKETRFPVNIDFPWEDRYELINGLACLNDNNGLMTIAPTGSKFYVYPQLKNNESLSGHTYSSGLTLIWDGIQFEWEDDDEVPFGEKSALAVSEFVKIHTSLRVEKDALLSASHEKQFMKTRLSIYRGES